MRCEDIHNMNPRYSHIVCENIETAIRNETNEIEIATEVRGQALHQDVRAPFFQQTNCFCEVISALIIRDGTTVVRILHDHFSPIFLPRISESFIEHDFQDSVHSKAFETIQQ